MNKPLRDLMVIVPETPHVVGCKHWLWKAGAPDQIGQNFLTWILRSLPIRQCEPSKRLPEALPTLAVSSGVDKCAINVAVMLVVEQAELDGCACGVFVTVLLVIVFVAAAPW